MRLLPERLYFWLDTTDTIAENGGVDVGQARPMKMTGLGWNSYFNAFMNLPETVEEGEAFEKRQRTADNVVKVIEAMAKELVQKSSGMTREKAFMEVLKRNPELEVAYRTATRT